MLIRSCREMTAGTKRGSEEMQHTGLSNGTVSLSPELASDLEPNDAKKVRLDPMTDNNGNQACGPSRVIHVRNIPMDATENELVQLVVPFGKVTNVMIMRTKKQAFIEMLDVANAITCVTYHQAVPAQVRGQRVFLQYSAYKELKTDQNAAALAAVSASGPLQISGVDTDPKTVLHAIVDNIVYPVTIDVLKQIFSRYGQVLRIIIFNKNNQFQALIQYSDSISAQTAKVSLDGQNIYNNCCTLKIDFSKLPTLNVKYNNEKSRDYTNPLLPPGEGMQQISPQGTETSSPISLSYRSGHSISPAEWPEIYQGAGHMLTAGSLSAAALPPGYGAPLTYMTHSPAGAPTQMHPLHALQVHLPQGLGPVTQMSALGGMGGFPGLGGLPSLSGLTGLSGLSAASMMNMGLSPAAASQMAANMAAIRLPHGMPQVTGGVVLVSNLDEEKVTPDALFTLFGVYGDVLRVKILYNKKDNALLQYSEAAQAQLALSHLDKVKVWGKQIRVAPSKHPVVQMPTDPQAEGAKLTKDYTNSPLHRYKKKGSKNYQNIYPPSATLHLSNIPPDVSGDLLKEEFAKYGIVTAFKFFEKDHKMALVQMASVDEAIMALIGMHNFQLGETSHLRVSFSKSTIAPISPSVSD